VGTKINTRNYSFNGQSSERFSSAKLSCSRVALKRCIIIIIIWRAAKFGGLATIWGACVPPGLQRGTTTAASVGERSVVTCKCCSAESCNALCDLGRIAACWPCS